MLLIDEIDKADTDFQDDRSTCSTDVLHIIEIDKTIKASTGRSSSSPPTPKTLRPVLSSCIFHHIAFPDPEMMAKVVRSLPDLDKRLSNACIETFYQLRTSGASKKPATAS